MADTTTTTKAGTSNVFVISPTAITETGWKIIQGERQELEKKQQGADCELVYQYYAAQLRIIDAYYKRAQKANAVLESKARKQAAKTVHEQRRKEAQAAKKNA
jgi:hypothetical protein